MLVIDAFFRPLQGFCNMFVYNRTSYVRFRAVYPDRPIWWSIQRACLDPNTPLLSQAQLTNSYRTTSFFHQLYNNNNNRGDSRLYLFPKEQTKRELPLKQSEDDQRNLLLLSSQKSSSRGVEDGSPLGVAIVVLGSILLLSDDLSMACLLYTSPSPRD